MNIQAKEKNRYDNSSSFAKRLFKDLRHNKILYLMILPIVAYYLIFHYGPMYGLQIAFKKYTPGAGIWGSPWVGFKHFTSFFNSYYFWRLLRNTFLINFYELIFSFPIPIIFALLLNELRQERFKKTVQTVSYLPHFISLVVICGIVTDFVASDGLINDAIAFFGGERTPLLQKPGLFRTIYISSGVWQGMGFRSIIYIAALSSIDQEIYEAATIDGANRFQRVWHITIPGIAPTIVILLILNIGSMLSVGFEKILLLYNPAIYETADVISTFVFRKGLENYEFSYSAAVGLFNSIVNFTLLFIANNVSRRVTQYSLW